MRRFLPIVACLLVLIGCDQKVNTPVPQPARPGELLEVSVIAPLAPARTTHVCRADDGTLWWVQETDADGGGDVAFTLAADGVPRATTLTSARVLAALSIREPLRHLGSGAGSEGGSREPAGQERRGRLSDPATAPSPQPVSGGNIQCLAADADGRIWFYFAGGTGRKAVAAVGSFDPRDGTIRVAARPDELAAATGMGASLVLARGSIVRSGSGRDGSTDGSTRLTAGGSTKLTAGDSLWVWVRHSDISALFRVDPRTGSLAKPFEAVRTASETADAPLAMTRPGQQLSAGADGALLLLDAPSVELWRIDAAGRATSLHSLAGLPRVLSGPAVDRAGRVIVLAADAPLIPARSSEEAMRPVLSAQYPAMLVIENGALRAIGRDALRLPAGVIPDTLRVQQLIDDPADDTTIGYDEGSGNLLRFCIVPASEYGAGHDRASD